MAIMSERSESKSRSHLEALLRARRLDHTLTTAGPGIEARWMAPTGIADLDAQLGGGLPRGHLSEVVGPRSSGRLAMAVSTLASATSRGEAVALIDPLDTFDPVSGSACGLDFARMLWIRGEAASAARVSVWCEYGTWQKSVDRAVKALNLVLQARGFGVVVLDLAEVATHVLKRLPYTTWLRLQRVIEGSETACMLVGSEPLARSSGGVSIQLAPGAGARFTTARVVRSRSMDTDRHVRVPLSAGA
jgi:hypothetical protein